MRKALKIATFTLIAGVLIWAYISPSPDYSNDPWVKMVWSEFEAETKHQDLTEGQKMHILNRIMEKHSIVGSN